MFSQGGAAPQTQAVMPDQIGGHNSGSLGQHDSTSSQGSGGQRQPEQMPAEQDMQKERTKQKNKRAQKKFRYRLAHASVGAAAKSKCFENFWQYFK